MEIIPKVIYNETLRKELSLKLGKAYICPECKVQNSEDEADTGWVKCPIVDNNYICLGSCIDVASNARATEFDDYRYFAITDFAQKIGENPNNVRKICLKHQMYIIENELIPEETEPYKREELEELLTFIKNLLTQENSDGIYSS